MFLPLFLDSQPIKIQQLEFTIIVCIAFTQKRTGCLILPYFYVFSSIVCSIGCVCSPSISVIMRPLILVVYVICEELTYIILNREEYSIRVGLVSI